MKRLWVILPLLFVFSCEDKEKPDTTSPNIVFVTPTNGEKIEVGARNFESFIYIKTQITDNEQVLKAECFIDDVSLGVKGGAPFNWDIDAYESLRQGNHVIKIIVEDINNNKAESSINFILDIYHGISMYSFILETTDDYTWTISNSADDGNSTFYYKQFILPFIAFDYTTLKEGIYKLEIREENYSLAISGKIDVDSMMNLNFSIAGNSYVLEVQRTNN